MTTATCKRWAAGAALVAVGWLLSPAAVPIYDGVGSPDDPYRYLGKSPAPSSASAHITVTDGKSSGAQLVTKETGPQAEIDIGEGSFTGPASFTFRATPVPSDVAPTQGTLDGNVYRYTVDSGAVLLPDKAQGFLYLRAGVMTKPAPLIVHRLSASDSWTPVTTTRSGRDMVNTPFRALGDYAVVRLPGSKALSAGGLRTVPLVLIGGGVTLLIALTVLVLRRQTETLDE